MATPLPVPSPTKLELQEAGPLFFLDDPQICECKHLRMETFTLAFPAGLCPLDWQSGDCLHHLSDAPAPLATPYTPREEDQIYEWKHLRMETFTIAFPDETSSLDWQCAKRLYKAARRSSTIEISVDQVGHVSPCNLQHTCKLSVTVHIDPEAFFCKFCFCELQLQRRPALHRHKVKLTGFSSQGLSKLIHALNGNIHFVKWNIPTPSPRSSQWKFYFNIPNGMVAFAYSFFLGNQNLWVKYYRRASSPRLYGMMLRSAASRGGPASR